MIKIENEVVELQRFPDDTIRLTMSPKRMHSYIVWQYEKNEEMILLMYISHYLRDHGTQILDLYMPYIPNARQDRVKTNHDVFTLKYFAEFLNSLHFNMVNVLDPHSHVSAALINNIRVENPKRYIEQVLHSYYSEQHDSKKLVTYYPDVGAMKRYSDMIISNCAFGLKRRNWETGEVEGVNITGNVEEVAGNDVLIVDDICTYGNTIVQSAKLLKERGAKDIYVFVTHCESNINQDMFQDGLVKKLYTTDSIVVGEAKTIMDKYVKNGNVELLHYEPR